MFVPSNDPNSIDDIDLMGVYVAPLEHYLGFAKAEVVDKFIREWDAVSYELRHYMSLMLKCNPNVMSLLWLAEEFYLYKHPVGELLIKNRELFSSKKAYHSFTGYAHGQLKRMKSYDAEAQDKVGKAREALARLGVTFANGTGSAIMPKGLSVEQVALVKKYEDLRGKYFSGFMGDKRRKLVEKVGYDAKNAAHLVRLLRMGVEFLNTGQLNVLREDKEELLEMKRGLWSLEEVQEEADALFALAETAYNQSKLPEQPDSAATEKLLMRAVQTYHGLRFTISAAA